MVCSCFILLFQRIYKLKSSDIKPNEHLISLQHQKYITKQGKRPIKVICHLSNFLIKNKMTQHRLSRETRESEYQLTMPPNRARSYKPYLERTILPDSGDLGPIKARCERQHGGWLPIDGATPSHL